MTRSILLLTWALLLAGCASSPLPESSATEPIDRPGARGFGAELMPLRIGIESHVNAVVRLVSTPTPRQLLPELAKAAPKPERVETIDRAPFDAEAIARISFQRDEDADDLAVRLFVDDLLGEDRRRMEQEIGGPAFITRLQRRSSDILPNHLDERDEELEAEYYNRIVPGLVRRPIRNAIKRTDTFRDLRDFAEHVTYERIPTRDVYDHFRSGRDWGRLSLRARLTADPVEFGWVRRGVRISSSQEVFRAKYSFRLTDDVSTRIEYRTPYHTGRFRLHAELDWQIDDDVALRLMAGDHLDFMAGRTGFASTRSPADGTTGALFWVEHRF